MVERGERARHEGRSGGSRSVHPCRGRGEGYLPASSVRLRAFLHPSWPSFGCFHGRHLVGSFTPGRRAARARARAGARTRGERKRETNCERDEDGGRGGGGGLVETRGREKEEEEEEEEEEEYERGRGARRHVRLADD